MNAGKTMIAPIRYSVVAKKPEAHLFEVSMTIDASLTMLPLELALPAWIPGSYMIREFSRNIVSIQAACRGKPVALVKIDKHSWSAPAVDGPLFVTCEVYAWDLSVRAAHLDRSHGFYNGTSLFLRIRGHEDLPCEVEIRKPAGRSYSDWRVATSLTRAAGTEPLGFGTYLAGDYDELIDHPVEMGRFVHGSFKAGGATHEVAITGPVPNLDLDRLLADLKKICDSQIALFEPARPRAPFDRYVFLVMTVNDGYGGLEHRASTALLTNRGGLPSLRRKARGKPAASDDAYRTFLGLASHEYFHSWNVKRIKPAVFTPTYSLDAEVHTRLLWVFEGFTSYYDDLTLVRTGLLSREQYLTSLGKTITSVHSAAGRLHQSVADSSFDAWTKYYRPDENTPNAVVSYYAKGSLVALCLDLLIRTETRGKRSLDDVMRALWVQFGRDFYAGKRSGLDEDGFVAVAEQATGVPLRNAVRAFAYGTTELPLDKLLGRFGVALTQKANARTDASLGVRVRSAGTDCVIATALEDQAGMLAGLSAGDVIAAVDGLRVKGDGLEGLLRRYRTGDVVKVHAFRRDELFTTQVTLQPSPGDAELTVAVSPAGVRRQLDAWLGPAAA